MTRDEILILSYFRIGFKRYKLISERIKSLSEITRDTVSEISSRTKIPLETLLDISNKEKCQEILDKLYKTTRSKSINFVTIVDEEYPKNLVDLKDRPLVLFYKGDLSIVSRNLKVGIIGTRYNDKLGEAYTKKLVERLVENNIVTVSGLARGIDIIAHRETIQRGGKTVGVLGGGVDYIYPREHAKDFEKIAENGCLVSEFFPGQAPLPRNFFIRNRIISGLSDVVVIVQAPENSGAIITGNYALAQGRKLLAIPGNIENRLHRGCNQMIKKGAKILIEIDDVLEELEYKAISESFAKNQKENISLSEEEEFVYSFIIRPTTVDDLSEMTGITISRLYSILLSLEIKGLVVQNIGGTFVRSFTKK